MRALLRRPAPALRPAILALRQAQPSDGEIGSAARALARLARVALPVPPTVVLRHSFWLSYLERQQATALWHAFAASPDHERAEPLRRLLAERPTPMELQIQLREALALHVERPWLARKGGPAASAAQLPSPQGGLRYALRPAFEAQEGCSDHRFERRLGLTSAEIDPALRAVWASALDQRALVTYQQGPGAPPPALSLLIQAIPELDSAGRALSRVPHEHDTTQIDAVWGLAEPLLRGQVRPDRWTLARSGLLLRHEPGERQSALWLSRDGLDERSLRDKGLPPPPLDAARLDELRRLALYAERILGAPQQIEWAHDGLRFWIIQTCALA